MLTKRIFDFVAALSGLLILSPILILIAAVVKLDSPGPVFFRQERVGIHGSVFRIYKFRTMTLNAEAKGQLTIGEDERVTRVGHALRRFKLDELPQLINVILGDMSLVGPRPEVVRYVAKYPKALRDAVLSVRPGITDWASIEFKEENAILGKSHDPERSYVETIMPIKLDYYVRYVHERSFVMDLKIIGHTLLAVASLHRKRDP
ncbi:Sugar transferase involved in LPS biosynthesis (colanic, teichoic acid) [Noviherbaspirillum humi]|uniref:Sugar transferase involved in LPS biosynthesis (Colanic, teichoic acid) n=1 Tax=Noviherbaspirillum humi TaxID=1688639 RepID=A0A239G885_9BURK|nr:Sugar transferase involved in LPS biosynthesis (colanic, teichoic acid) [Noviherbaspirillum humi]